MRISGPRNHQIKNRGRPILKSEIEEAHKNTLSCTSAAKYLGVGYVKYCKYAKLYGLFEGHKNPLGIGIPKGVFGRRGVPISRIFKNEFPKYSLYRLKSRMIARRMIPEMCSLCGFEEKRVSDKRTPLLLTFKNGDRDYAKDNLILLCYNCMFLTTGVPCVAHQNQITAQMRKHAQGIEDRSNYPNDRESELYMEPEEDYDKKEYIVDIDIKQLQKEALEEL
jgi:hypothetical protein